MDEYSSTSVLVGGTFLGMFDDNGVIVNLMISGMRSLMIITFPLKSSQIHDTTPGLSLIFCDLCHGQTFPCSTSAHCPSHHYTLRGTYI